MGGIKLSKQKRRLARRVKAFENIGNVASQNPGKQSAGNYHVMRKPGSNTKS